MLSTPSTMDKSELPCLFDFLPREIKKEIVNHLSPYDRYPLYFLSTEFRELMNSFIVPVTSNIKADKLCIEGDLLSLVFSGAEFNLARHISQKVCKKGYYRIFYWLKEKKLLNWIAALYGACKAGNDRLIKEITDYLLPHNPPLEEKISRHHTRVAGHVFYEGVVAAANGGHLALLKIMMSLIGENLNPPAHLILSAAFKTANKELYNYALSLGPKNYDYDSAIRLAIVKGHSEPIKWFEASRLSFSSTYLQIASRHGQLELLKMLLERYNEAINFDILLVSAFQSDNRATIEFLLPLAKREIDWKTVGHEAACQGNKWLLSLALNELSSGSYSIEEKGQYLSKAFARAADNCQLAIIKILTSYQRFSRSSWNYLLGVAAGRDDNECLRFALRKGADDYHLAYHQAQRIKAQWIMDLMEKLMNKKLKISI